jgi:preprotein translocase subunit SecY
MSNNNNKNNRLPTTLAMFGIVSVLIVTIITAFSAVLTQAVEQVNAQSLNVTKQTTYITDVNVHFKTACISVIVFTYCW